MPGAGLSNAMKGTLLALLDQTATVYTRGTGGTYSVQAQTGLKCLLQEAPRSAAATSEQRAELADLCVLYWDPAYSMPEGAQVEVSSRSGQRFNVAAGTIAPDVGPGGVVVMRHCDVRRARSG